MVDNVYLFEHLFIKVNTIKKFPPHAGCPLAQASPRQFIFIFQYITTLYEKIS
jgi:hypothetical protein